MLKLTKSETEALKKLEKEYKNININYFDGLLPDPKLIVRHLSDAFMQCSNSKEIEIDKETLLLPYRFTSICLQHEMIHLKLWSMYPDDRYSEKEIEMLYHGASFKTELKRLFELGAYYDLL